MREIAAASDFDFVSVEPRRPARGDGARRGKGRQKKAGSAPAWLSAIWRYRTPALGVAALAALLAMIVVNAVYLQRQRHPAPLFGATFKIEPPKPPPRPRPARFDALLSDKMPEAALSKVVASDTALAPPPAYATAPSASAPPAAPAKKKADAIGALLSGNDGAKGVDPAPAPSKSVLTAQRALQKLGAAVKADGAFGATTKKALEAFQRDNHLPVNGELTAKTRHLLAARSGLPVE